MIHKYYSGIRHPTRTHAQCEMKANSNISIPVSNYYHNLGVRTVFMGLQAKELYLEAKIRHTESA